MIKDSDIHNAYEKVVAQILDADFCGYDPYDGLNTDLHFLSKTTATRFFAVYFNKFSPINFRPLLKVKKSRQLMTMCTTANALVSFWPQDDRQSQLLRIGNRVWDYMQKASLKKKYGYDCWDAHEFPIQMRNRYTHGDVASVVGNQIFGEFLINYSGLIQDERITDAINGLREFFVEKFFARNEDFEFFKYKSEHPNTRFTMNASLKAARYLIDAGKFLECSRFDSEINAAFLSVIRLQKPDGRWNYNRSFTTGKEKAQVDFHQGYILDDILAYMVRYGFDEPFITAYEKGLRFYREKQFLASGQGLYRWPRKWPVNIHNQAQGILTFTRASAIHSDYLAFADTIAEWTIRNMQGEDGSFYYLKYPGFTNKIPYIRWSDAAMAYSFAHWLKHRSELPENLR